MQIIFDGFLHSKVFDTRIKSANVQHSERWLGYLLGPAFVLSMFYISGQSYLNQFYTEPSSSPTPPRTCSPGACS